MWVLVYGCGVIGSLLVHELCSVGNQAAVIGRGTWKDVLSRDGLWIRHVLQHQETVDHPLVMEKAADHVEFDLVFSVMQSCQQEKILDQLAAVNSGMVVLVGNNPLCAEMEATIHSLSPHKQVLFDFLNSAGVREKTYVKSLHSKKVELLLGGVHGMRPERDQILVSAAFGGSGCKLTWCDDMEGYLYTHAAFVPPCACLCYGKGCDLRKADCRDIQLTVEAAKEGYRLIEKTGMKIWPAEDEKYDQGRSWQILMNVMLWGIAKTRIALINFAIRCPHGTGCCRFTVSETIDQEEGMDLTM